MYDAAASRVTQRQYDDDLPNVHQPTREMIRPLDRLQSSATLVARGSATTGTAYTGLARAVSAVGREGASIIRALSGAGASAFGQKRTSGELSD